MFKIFKDNEAVKVILAGAALNMFLAAIKFVAGVAGRSTALVADSFHSLSDLLTDAVTLFTHQIGRMPKDKEHPYGHGRAETIGTTVIGGAIILAGLGLGYHVWEIIASGQRLVPGWVAAVAAVFSILSKETLFRYSRKIGEKVHSPSIIANAWHHRSDAFSSIASLIGILGAMYGYPLMDPIAAGVVALMVAKVGYGISANALRDLMDTSLGEEELKRITEIIQAIPGVKQFHDLRTRRIGGNILMDVHILVDPEISVTEGHNIAENVRLKLHDIYDNVQDILVHVDAEDDRYEIQPYPITREELKKLIAPIIASTSEAVRETQMRVHYLRGKIIVELFVQTDKNKTIEETQRTIKDLKTRLEALEKIDEARVYLDVDSF